MHKLDVSLLKNLPLFSKLDREQIREILDLATPRRIVEGAEVFHQGHEADRFFLLLDGYLRVVRTTEDGDQVIVLHIVPGQLCGIAPAFQRDDYPATAIAATETIVLSWARHHWDRFCEDYPSFAAESFKSVGSRVGQIQKSFTEIATQAVEQRVASALLRMADQSGVKTSNGIEIAFPITRQNLSDMTGTTLHTVSRLLSGWQKDGVIISRRKHILVKDHNALAVLCRS